MVTLCKCSRLNELSYNAPPPPHRAQPGNSPAATFPLPPVSDKTEQCSRHVAPTCCGSSRDCVCTVPCWHQHTGWNSAPIVPSWHIEGFVHVTCLSLHSTRNGELVQYDMQYWILSAHKVLTYKELRAVSGVFRAIDPHPLSIQRVCPPPAPKTHSPGGEGRGGQYFGRRQTLDRPLTV